MVMPSFKIKALKARGEDEEDDEKPITDGLGSTVCPKCGSNRFNLHRDPVRMECDDCGHVSNRRSESSRKKLISALLEDCPCDLIPADATPTDGTEDTGKKPEDREASDAEPKADDAIEVVLGKSNKEEPVSDTPKHESQLPESRDDVMHRMVYLTKPKYQARLQAQMEEKKGQATKAVNEGTPTAANAAAMAARAIGTSAPTAAMPSGKDEDAERILQEGAKPTVDMGNVVASAGQQGIPMPEHKTGTGTEILGAFRKFVKG